MDEFNKKLTESEILLPDAIEDLFKLVNDRTLVINEIAINTILDFLHPVGLLANYLDHNSKRHFFISFPVFEEIMYEYLYNSAPSKIFKEFANYKDQNGQFKLLFDNDESYDRERFWDIAAIDNPVLSAYALQLINLLATLKKSYLQNLGKMTFE